MPRIARGNSSFRYQILLLLQHILVLHVCLFQHCITYSYQINPLLEFIYVPQVLSSSALHNLFLFKCQSNPFAMAYRHFGDPSWYELEEIFGPKEALEKEPRADVIVVSSESEDEVHEPAASANIRCVLVPRVVERPPTTTSRNIQMSIWDFVGYASDSYTTMDTKESTSNMKSKKSKAKKVSAPPLMMEDPKPGESGSASSCCSNDPYGKRHVP